MSKFKIGDKVKVRSDLEEGTDYGKYGTTFPMIEFKGLFVTITKVYSDFYDIKEDKGLCGWTDEMFEPLKVTNWRKRIENEI